MLRVRIHGDSGPPVVVLHGGPGAPGSARGLALGLAGAFRVVEPFQRPSGGEPLTVARHVEDLREGLAAWFPGERPALVGHSWGAMLGIAFAARHPGLVAAVAMVGSGTFDARARALFVAEREARQTPALREALAALAAAPLPEDERLERRATLLDSIYAVDAEPDDGRGEPVDAQSNRETWDDMLRLQADGTYPASLVHVKCPVLMLHGEGDPHPGRAIRDSLAPFLDRLAYAEFPRCGHEPWRERAARDAFFATLASWLERALSAA